MKIGVTVLGAVLHHSSSGSYSQSGLEEVSLQAEGEVEMAAGICPALVELTVMGKTDNKQVNN